MGEQKHHGMGDIYRLDPCMMVSKGRGYLVGVIAIVVPLMIDYLVDAVMGKGYSNLQHWPFAVGMLVSAVAIWFLGCALNKGNARILVDPKLCEEVILENHHSFFCVKLEYWAFACIAGAVSNLLK